jgi:hypothetical protein
VPKGEVFQIVTTGAMLPPVPLVAVPMEVPPV